MNTELTPEAFVNAVLAIVADPGAAKKRADELAVIKAAQGKLDQAAAALDARDKELGRRDRDLQTKAADLVQQRQKLEAAEAALEHRVQIIIGRENRFQADVVAHGQAQNRTSAELNTREDNVGKRERELDKAEKKLATDRAALDRKLAKAREFVDDAA